MRSGTVSDEQGAAYDGDGNLVNWWTLDGRGGFAAPCTALLG